MKWLKITLSPEEVAEGKASRLSVQFNTAFRRSLMPTSMILLMSKKPSGEGGQTYYLSPESTRFLAEFLPYYNAAECEEPPKDDAWMLAGNNGSVIKTY